jgi:hypothetical protein
MFPVEFAKLHQKPAPAAPFSTPAPATPIGTTATGGQRYALTINGRRTEVSVAEVA